MKVYIVTSGCWSDIDRVFLDEATALEYVGDDSDMRVEEYQTCSRVPQCVAWTKVWMNRDGAVENVEQFDFFDDEDNPLDIAPFFWVRTDNEERAIKVANERRARLIAEGGWE